MTMHPEGHTNRSVWLNLSERLIATGWLVDDPTPPEPPSEFVAVRVDRDDGKVEYYEVRRDTLSSSEPAPLPTPPEEPKPEANPQVGWIGDRKWKHARLDDQVMALGFDDDGEMVCYRESTGRLFLVDAADFVWVPPEPVQETASAQEQEERDCLRADIGGDPAVLDLLDELDAVTEPVQEDNEPELSDLENQFCPYVDQVRKLAWLRGYRFGITDPLVVESNTYPSPTAEVDSRDRPKTDVAWMGAGPIWRRRASDV